MYAYQEVDSCLFRNNTMSTFKDTIKELGKNNARFLLGLALGYVLGVVFGLPVIGTTL